MTLFTKTQSSNTVIYGVALVDPVENGARPEVLRRLARSSGGEAICTEEHRGRARRRSDASRRISGVRT